MKRTLIRLHQVLAAELGVDSQRFFRSVRGLPYFLRDWAAFRKGYSGPIALMPCLHDRFEEGGATKSEYFWQDLLVAREIHCAGPKRHVDVGSRVDGFVAHVASFREIEVFDVRPMSTEVPGLVFRQADLMNSDSVREYSGYCDSLSCLHAIEHFGLGRYGDAIDAKGYERGFSNMAQLLEPGGTFYLSTPIGRERVEFNANWVFDPRTVMRCAVDAGLKLLRLTVCSTDGPREVFPDDDALELLAESHYNLGIFVFRKELTAGTRERRGE
jgi:hypothetical protein